MAKHLLITKPSPYCIFLLSDHSFSHLFLSFFKITCNCKTIISDFCLTSSSILTTLASLPSTLCHIPPHASHILLFYDHLALPATLHSPSPAILSLSILTCSALTDFLDSHASSSLLGQWFLGKWSGWHNDGWTQALVKQASILTQEHLPLPPSSHSRMFREWNDDFLQKPHDPLYKPLFNESSSSLHPFTLGCLDVQSRHLQSAIFQTITSHGFHADYSNRFHPSTSDTTLCPFCPCHRQHKHFTLSHTLTYCPALSH